MHSIMSCQEDGSYQTDRLEVFKQSTVSCVRFFTGHQLCSRSQVAFPSSSVPLQIFEARYRVLFSTLLAGGDKCACRDHLHKCLVLPCASGTAGSPCGS